MKVCLVNKERQGAQTGILRVQFRKSICTAGEITGFIFRRARNAEKVRMRKEFCGGRVAASSGLG